MRTWLNQCLFDWISEWVFDETVCLTERKDEWLDESALASEGVSEWISSWVDEWILGVPGLQFFVKMFGLFIPRFRKTLRWDLFQCLKTAMNKHIWVSLEVPPTDSCKAQSEYTVYWSISFSIRTKRLYLYSFSEHLVSPLVFRNQFTSHSRLFCLSRLNGICFGGSSRLVILCRWRLIFNLQLIAGHWLIFY